eukprot:TRINITY_DN3628_c0_g1_i1.p1 TRINITY_DN3628_c0_g1~~TRINITY_DN3628_c0_g1_i1.p1  ORF type:complete len:2430 (+),score=769.77 TRINITY_DN3628_c0_g1_i1:112-7401(+)
MTGGTENEYHGIRRRPDEGDAGWRKGQPAARDWQRAGMARPHQAPFNLPKLARYWVPYPALEWIPPGAGYTVRSGVFWSPVVTEGWWKDAFTGKLTAEDTVAGKAQAGRVYGEGGWCEGATVPAPCCTVKPAASALTSVNALPLRTLAPFAQTYSNLTPELLAAETHDLPMVCGEGEGWVYYSVRENLPVAYDEARLARTGFGLWYRMACVAADPYELWVAGRTQPSAQVLGVVDAPAALPYLPGYVWVPFRAGVVGVPYPTERTVSKGLYKAKDGLLWQSYRRDTVPEGETCFEGHRGRAKAARPTLPSVLPSAGGDGSEGSLDGSHDAPTRMDSLRSAVGKAPFSPLMANSPMSMPSERAASIDSPTSPLDATVRSHVLSEASMGAGVIPQHPRLVYKTTRRPVLDAEKEREKEKEKEKGRDPDATMESTDASDTASDASFGSPAPFFRDPWAGVSVNELPRPPQNLPKMRTAGGFWLPFMVFEHVPYGACYIAATAAHKTEGHGESFLQSRFERYDKVFAEGRLGVRSPSNSPTRRDKAAREAGALCVYWVVLCEERARQYQHGLQYPAEHRSFAAIANVTKLPAGLPVLPDPAQCGWVYYRKHAELPPALLTWTPPPEALLPPPKDAKLKSPQLQARPQPKPAAKKAEAAKPYRGGYRPSLFSLSAPTPSESAPSDDPCEASVRTLAGTVVDSPTVDMAASTSAFALQATRDEGAGGHVDPVAGIRTFTFTPPVVMQNRQGLWVGVEKTAVEPGETVFPCPAGVAPSTPVTPASVTNSSQGSASLTALVGKKRDGGGTSLRNLLGNGKQPAKGGGEPAADTSLQVWRGVGAGKAPEPRHPALAALTAAPLSVHKINKDSVWVPYHVSETVVGSYTAFPTLGGHVFRRGSINWVVYLLEHVPEGRVGFRGRTKAYADVLGVTPHMTAGLPHPPPKIYKQLVKDSVWVPFPSPAHVPPEVQVLFSHDVNVPPAQPHPPPREAPVNPPSTPPPQGARRGSTHAQSQFSGGSKDAAAPASPPATVVRRGGVAGARPTRQVASRPTAATSASMARPKYGGLGPARDRSQTASLARPKGLSGGPLGHKQGRPKSPPRSSSRSMSPPTPTRSTPKMARQMSRLGSVESLKRSASIGIAAKSPPTKPRQGPGVSSKRTVSTTGRSVGSLRRNGSPQRTRPNAATPHVSSPVQRRVGVCPSPPSAPVRNPVEDTDTISLTRVVSQGGSPQRSAVGASVRRPSVANSSFAIGSPTSMAESLSPHRATSAVGASTASIRLPSGQDAANGSTSIGFRRTSGGSELNLHIPSPDEIPGPPAGPAICWRLLHRGFGEGYVPQRKSFASVLKITSLPYGLPQATKGSHWVPYPSREQITEGYEDCPTFFLNGVYYVLCDEVPVPEEGFAAVRLPPLPRHLADKWPFPGEVEALVRRNLHNTLLMKLVARAKRQGVDKALVLKACQQAVAVRDPARRAELEAVVEQPSKPGGMISWLRAFMDHEKNLRDDRRAEANRALQRFQELNRNPPVEDGDGGAWAKQDAAPPASGEDEERLPRIVADYEALQELMLREVQDPAVDRLTGARGTRVSSIPLLGTVNTQKGLKEHLAATLTLPAAHPKKRVFLFFWLIEAVFLVHHFRLTNEQIFGVLCMTDRASFGTGGGIGQMKTGEGKTITIALAAAYYILMTRCAKTGRRGISVDVMTSSETLAARDALKAKPLYNLLGISVGHNCREPGDGGAAAPPPDLSAVYKLDVVYGTTAEFQFTFIRDVYLNQNERGTRTYDIAIVDEVDNMLIDSSGRSARLSASIPGMDQLHWMYYLVMKKMAEWGEGLDAARLEETLRTHNAVTTLLPLGLRHLVLDNLGVWIRSAMKAKSLASDREYVISEKKVINVDHVNTGAIQYGTVLSNGMHQFLQVREGVPVSDETAIGGFSSVLAFFQLYQWKTGLTGTIGEAEEQKEFDACYQLHFFYIPPHHESVREEKVDITVDETQWLQAIAAAVHTQSAAAKARPTLIIAESIKTCEQIRQHLALVHPTLQTQSYTGVQDAHQDDILKAAGAPGMVTCSTNLAGRGMDIVTNEASEEHGGLYVVCTFLPSNQRVEMQAAGRTCRQGKLGTFHLIVNTENPEARYNIDVLKYRRKAGNIRRAEHKLKVVIPCAQHTAELFCDFCALKDGVFANTTRPLPFEGKYEKRAWRERWMGFMGTYHKQYEKVRDQSEANAFIDAQSLRYRDFRKALLGDLEHQCVVKNPVQYARRASDWVAAGRWVAARQDLEKAAVLPDGEHPTLPLLMAVVKANTLTGPPAVKEVVRELEKSQALYQKWAASLELLHTLVPKATRTIVIQEVVAKQIAAVGQALEDIAAWQRHPDGVPLGRLLRLLPNENRTYTSSKAPDDGGNNVVRWKRLGVTGRLVSWFHEAKKDLIRQSLCDAKGIQCPPLGA